MNDWDEVKEVTLGMRRIFERILEDSIETRETEGSCLYASILLSMSLNQFSKAKTLVCGGSPNEGCGIVDPQGVMHGHYWVEGKLPNGKIFVADITADQFGYPKIFIIDEKEASEIYFPGNPEVIQKHVEEELDKCAESGTIYHPA